MCNLNILIILLITINTKNGINSLPFCEYNGQYIPSSDCRGFYQCSNRFPYYIACPAKTLFDVNSNTCNHEYLVRCRGSIPNGKGISTTSKRMPTYGSVTYQEFSNALLYNGYRAPTYEQYRNFINGALSQGITSKRELAMFLAQIIHESGGLVFKIEQACGSGCVNCPGQYITNDDYPGKRYCGRGYIQLVKIKYLT